MQNRSSLDFILDDKIFLGDIPASHMLYTQHYHQDAELHYHRCLEIGRCVEGSGVQFIGNEIYPFSGNTISIIHKECIHDSHIVMTNQSEPPSRWKYIFADLEKLRVEIESGSYNTYDMDLVQLFEMMFHELGDKNDDYQQLFVNLLEAFLLKAKRAEPLPRSQTNHPNANQIASALNYVAQNYHADINVEQLAKSCNLSTSYFRKVFRENLGVSPQQYIIRVRLAMAEHLLSTTKKKIITVSEEVGFNSLSSFNRLFKRAYGVSPRDFR